MHTTPFNLMEMDGATVVSHMSEAINRQDFQEALRAGGIWLDIHRTRPDNAHFWFQMFLAASLSGQHAAAEHYRRQAAESSNFTDEMRGDLLRDQVNAVIRAFRPGHEPEGFSRREMFAMLDLAWDLHATDPERRIADLIILAKLHYYYGHYAKADWQCTRAADLSEGLLHPNPQWDRNLRFIWMRVKARRNDLKDARRLAKDILEDAEEKAEARKKAARLMRALPFWAVGLLDWKENSSRK